MSYAGPIHRWDVFWATLEPHPGSEQGGRRPVIVVSNDGFNAAMPVVTAVPVTRREGKRRSVYSFEVVLPPGTIGHQHASVVMPYQVRTIARSRLLTLAGRITAPEHRDAIESQLLEHLGVEFTSDGAPER